jgi:GNAT superfamily N-acetyltransferase
MSISIRSIAAQDSEILLSLIRDLAAHQGHINDVKATSKELHQFLSSGSSPFECLLAEEGARIVGFALFFQSFSSWEGHPGIHLDDLYVVPEKRGSGIGKLLVSQLANLALERGCKRMEFISLVSNQSSYNFNLSLGARPMPEFLRWQLTQTDLHRLSKHSNLNFSGQIQSKVIASA